MGHKIERTYEFMVAFYRTMPDGRQRSFYERCFSAEQVKNFRHRHRLAERITSEQARKPKDDDEPAQ